MPGLLSDFFSTGQIGPNENTILNKFLTTKLPWGSNSYNTIHKKLNQNINTSLSDLLQGVEDYQTESAKRTVESRAALGDYSSNISSALNQYQSSAEQGLASQLFNLKSLGSKFDQDYAKQQAGIATQREDLTKYLNENYYKDYLSSPQAQAVLRELTTNYQDVINSTKNNAIRSGQTPGAEIAARTSATKDLSSQINKLSAEGEDVKRGVYQDYLSQLNALTNLESSQLANKQANERYIFGAGSDINKQKQDILNTVLSGNINLSGQEYTGLRDILNTESSNDLAVQNMISNALNQQISLSELNRQIQADKAESRGNMISNIGNVLPLLVGLL